MATVEELVGTKFAAIAPHLDERQRRLWLGVEARALGRGGVAAAARAPALACVPIQAPHCGWPVPWSRWWCGAAVAAANGDHLMTVLWPYGSKALSLALPRRAVTEASSTLPSLRA